MDEKYMKQLVRSREWKKTEAGRESTRRSKEKYDAKEEVKEKKRTYYLKKKEAERQRIYEETGEYPPMRGRGRPKKLE